MGNRSKRQKQILRELARSAYKAELGSELDKLHAEFQRWKAGALEPGDLAHAIHEFHDGPNRYLFKLYNQLDPGLVVARAIGRGLLDRSSVPREILDELESLTDFAVKHYK